MDTLVVRSLTDHTSFYGISLDVVFTAIVSSSIFLLGAFLKFLYDKHSESKHLREVREFFLTSLRQLLEPMKKQADLFKAFVNETLADSDQDFMLEQTLAAYLDPLHGVSQLEVFNAMMKGSEEQSLDRAKHYHQMLATLEFLRNLKESARERFWDFLQAYRRHQQVWNENVNSVGRQHDAFVLQALANSSIIDNDAFLKRFNSIVHTLSLNDEYRSYRVIKAKLLDPIVILCREIADQRAATILPLVINAHAANDNIVRLKSSYSSFIAKEGDALIESRDNLLKSIDYFSN